MEYLCRQNSGNPLIVDTMNTKYVDLFVEYLQKDCGYRESNIRTNTYKYDGNEYGRVEVLSDGYVIQAFVLMSAEHCRKLDKRFPFYRTYSQWNDYGFLTPPACNVAVFRTESNKWEIHSSSDLRLELTSPTFLNYDAAVERFNRRLAYVGNKKLKKVVSRLSFSFLAIVVIYAAAHVLSANGLFGDYYVPLNSDIVSIIVISMILLLLPPLIPYIKSVTIKGISLDLNQD